MRIVETVISGPTVSVMNIFAGMDPSAEQHGNEHYLPRPQVHHVDSFKEMTQILIFQKFAIEEFRCSLDCAASSDQFVEIFIHGALRTNGSNRDVSTTMRRLAQVTAEHRRILR